VLCINIQHVLKTFAEAEHQVLGTLEFRPLNLMAREVHQEKQMKLERVFPPKFSENWTGLRTTCNEIFKV